MLCKKCKSSYSEEFQQIVNLKKSGLLIYVHNNDSMHKENIESKRSIILHNSGHRELKRFDYIAELCQYKTKCFKCQTLIQQIRNLIDNVTIINRNEVLGICCNCKRSPQRSKCKRCEYLMFKFLNNETKRYLENKMCLTDFMCTLRQVLLSMTQGKIICKHNICLNSESIEQLDKILKYIHWPETSRQPNVDSLLDILTRKGFDNSTSNNEKLLSDVLLKRKPENPNDPAIEDNLSESGINCICKYLHNHKVKETLSIKKTPIVDDSISNTLLDTKINSKMKVNISSEKLAEKSFKSLESNVSTAMSKISPKLKQYYHRKRTIKNKYTKYNLGIISKIDKYKIQKKKNSKSLPDSKNELIVKIIKQRKEIRPDLKVRSKPENVELSSRRESLATESLKDYKDVDFEKSESILECRDGSPAKVSEMIKGTKIVPCGRRHRSDHNLRKFPALFQRQQDDFESLAVNKTQSVSACSNAEQNNIIKSGKETSKANSGIIVYQLSNREFITKGWTELPTTKIMRRMNIYRMIPSDTKYGWFENHKNQKILYYDSGEKLAEIYDDCGKWFYKNGNLALDYYRTAEVYSGKRCVVYNSNVEKRLKNKKSVHILACFDYFGNGIVYDGNGDTRLKFNQSEGLLIDKKIGPPGRWKWHALNEPPITYPVFFNTFVKKELYRKDFITRDSIKKQDESMTNIELENFRKEREAKLLKEYKSFEIRTKVVKLNDCFTLRVINQAKIYVQFRCDRKCFKVNVGMLLEKEEILDTDIAEVSEVATPYDRPE